MKKVFGFIRFIAAFMLSLAFAVTAILTIPVDNNGILFHRNARAWARTILRVCRIRVRVKGLEHLDLSGRYVYVSNHASAFDIPSILASIPDQIRIVYKKELHVIPLFGWGLKWGSYIGIDRGGGTNAMKSLEEAAQKIRNGASVLLYAEGTRTTDGRLQMFKRGAFNLAVRSGVPVVPLTVNGSFHILPKHSVSVHPGDVELVLAPPIPIEGEGKEAEMKLMERVHEAIERTYVVQ